MNVAFGILPIAPVCGQPQNWQPLFSPKPLEHAAVGSHAGADEYQAADFLSEALRPVNANYCARRHAQQGVWRLDALGQQLPSRKHDDILHLQR